jgi:hypothetical protein
MITIPLDEVAHGLSPVELVLSVWVIAIEVRDPAFLLLL